MKQSGLQLIYSHPTQRCHISYKYPKADATQAPICMGLTGFHVKQASSFPRKMRFTRVRSTQRCLAWIGYDNHRCHKQGMNTNKVHHNFSSINPTMVRLLLIHARLAARYTIHSITNRRAVSRDQLHSTLHVSSLRS
jgi:hypothetical protein